MLYSIFSLSLSHGSIVEEPVTDPLAFMGVVLWPGAGPLTPWERLRPPRHVYIYICILYIYIYIGSPSPVLNITHINEFVNPQSHGLGLVVHIAFITTIVHTHMACPGASLWQCACAMAISGLPKAPTCLKALILLLLDCRSSSAVVLHFFPRLDHTLNCCVWPQAWPALTDVFNPQEPNLSCQINNII